SGRSIACKIYTPRFPMPRLEVNVINPARHQCRSSSHSEEERIALYLLLRPGQSVHRYRREAMSLEIRKIVRHVEEVFIEGGKAAERPVIAVAVAAVIRN